MAAGLFGVFHAGARALRDWIAVQLSLLIVGPGPAAENLHEPSVLVPPRVRHSQTVQLSQRGVERGRRLLVSACIVILSILYYIVSVAGRGLGSIYY